MSVRDEIKTIQDVSKTALELFDSGDHHSAENFILGLQLWLNRHHRPRSLWRARVLQHFCKN